MKCHVLISLKKKKKKSRILSATIKSYVHPSDSDKPAHLFSLIWVLTWYFVSRQGSKVYLDTQQGLICLLCAGWSESLLDTIIRYIFSLGGSGEKYHIVTDKRGYSYNIFFFLDKNIHCGHSLEVPRRGTSNEYPQCMFSSRNQKTINTVGLKKKKNIMELCCHIKCKCGSPW